MGHNKKESISKQPVRAIILTEAQTGKDFFKN